MGNVVCNFVNEQSVVLENVPAGTRWIYACYDRAAGSPKLVTWDIAEVVRWMADPARVAPWIEPQEVFDCQTEEGPEVEMDVERVAAE